MRTMFFITANQLPCVGTDVTIPSYGFKVEYTVDSDRHLSKNTPYDVLSQISLRKNSRPCEVVEFVRYENK